MSDVTVASAKNTETTRPPLAPPLRLVLPGGEGHLGRLLAEHFSTAGHKVITLSRNPGCLTAPSGRTLTAHPACWTTINWDGRTLGGWIEALDGADVLINLAGRSVDCRYNAENRHAILQSRVESTCILGEAIQKLRRPPAVWLNASTATIYRHSFDRAMDEAGGEIGGTEPDAHPSWQFSVEVARQWEQSLFSSHTPKTRKIAMRTAMVMSSRQGGIFEIVLRLVRLGLGGAWGSGRQYISWIHEQDFLRAIAHLIWDERIRGVVNLAAPAPLPNREFLSALREAWGTSFGLPATRWMLEVGAALLQTETELLLKSRRVIPGILPQHGFEFRFPSWPQAAQDLVSRWRGASRATRDLLPSDKEEAIERAN